MGGDLVRRSNYRGLHLPATRALNLEARQRLNELFDDCLQVRKFLRRSIVSVQNAVAACEHVLAALGLFREVVGSTRRWACRIVRQWGRGATVVLMMVCAAVKRTGFASVRPILVTRIRWLTAADQRAFWGFPSVQWIRKACA